MKIHERILNDTEEKDKEAEFKKNTRLVEDLLEYKKLRVPKTWTNPPKLADLKSDLLGALSGHAEAVEKIDRHLGFYNTTPGIGRPLKTKGRSNAQPRAIRKAAEKRYASLSEPFLDSPTMFKGSPTTLQDVEGTRQAMLVLNKQMRYDIDAVEFIDNYIKDLVDTGTAIIRTSW